MTYGGCKLVYCWSVSLCEYSNGGFCDGKVYLLGSTRVRGCLCHGAHMKSSQGPVKYVMGCWTHHGTDSIYTKKTCQSGHGVRGPQKTYLKAYMIHCHGPSGLRWERQKKRWYGRNMRDPRQWTIVIVKIKRFTFYFLLSFGGEGGEKTKTRGQKNGQTLNLKYI